MNSASPLKPTRPFHLRRIGIIATHTFTQLVRMKVFYFLAFFAVVVIGANFLELPTHASPENAGTELLYSIKSTSLGCMSIFSLVLGVVATGLLLPKDVEDRTLYTILAKPVPRLDYLVGKLCGVALLIFLSLLAMDLLMNLVLQPRMTAVLERQLEFARQRDATEATLERISADVRALGPTWSLQGAVLVVFLRSLLIASLALLLSTFSTSTLFTAIVGFLVLFAGFFQAEARDAWFGHHGGVAQVGRLIMTVLLPDMQFYNLVDAVIEGKPLKAIHLGMSIASTAFYVVTYTFASWLIFARKEF
ncbi:ABC-type Na+ efflux pump permease subunit [Haloferula luteola]|uniref:ABC-type Na+ efflux pump permease subunit n=1 Tax=Haloferula luteola TaxID=595692 RepID=A0A840VLP1_9BACT|nr:ABC transporter permease [Haloferula luteola]MBB5353541.1 ABC-type Na+ efflux pump permease subunit [Haloferula luteola]